MDKEKKVTESEYLWREGRRRSVVYLMCLVVYWYIRKKLKRRENIDRSMSLERDRVRDEIMSRILSHEQSRDIIRMGPKVFINLCHMLEKYGGLKPTRRVTIEEQVAKTLYILSHHAKNREVQFWFRRSGETTSRHLHSVLRSIIELEDRFLKQPDDSNIPAEILGNNRFFPYFKDCVGAIDGTHIRAKVSNIDAPKFQGRKNFPTQNVLAACSFDLKFTYVLPGWEGTASDSRTIKNALSREDRLTIPEGKYYLVDAGIMLRSGLIAPYSGVRYHLKEYSNNPPQNPKELFNLRHASLHNAIERAFGALKKRFPIVASANMLEFRCPKR